MPDSVIFANCLFVQNDPWHSSMPDRGVFANRSAEVWYHLTAGISCWKKWKRLLHPNQNSSITPLWIINYHLLTSEYQQCSLTPLKQFSHVTQSSRLVVRIGVMDRIFAIITLSLSGFTWIFLSKGQPGWDGAEKWEASLVTWNAALKAKCEWEEDERTFFLIYYILLSN